MEDTSEITANMESDKIERDGYGLLVLVCVLGGLPSRYSQSYPNNSSSSAVRQHAIMILIKMALDIQYGQAIGETVEASLATLLQTLNINELENLTITLVSKIPQHAIQYLLLTRLPIYSAPLALFRQNVAKAFLDISPTAPPSAFLDTLRSRSPFTSITRDIANEDTRKLKYAMLIFDVAISHPPPEHTEMTKQIIRQLQNMHQRIIDGRAAFIVRTEAKEVIQRIWMRLRYTMKIGVKVAESLDKWES
jgi:hypothetical protein